MSTINISVTDKIASVKGTPIIVCGNSSYIASFTFDAEWDAESEKVARFTYLTNGVKKFIDKPLNDENKCRVPVLINIEKVIVGVYAGDLRTTTGADIKCKKSILCETEEEGETLLVPKVTERVPYPVNDTGVDNGSAQQILKSAGDGRTYWGNETRTTSVNECPFKFIDLPLNTKGYIYEYIDGVYEKKEAENCSPIVKCPKYLGFRIEDDETRIYLYIGTMRDGVFVLDEKYHIDTTSTGAVNYFRQTHNRFIETDGTKYFYYKINEGSKVSFVGSDTFPQGESDIIGELIAIGSLDLVIGVGFSCNQISYYIRLCGGCPFGYNTLIGIQKLNLRACKQLAGFVLLIK